MTNTRKRRAWAKENGICVNCSKPAEPNRVRCKRCLINDAKSTTRYIKNHPGYVAMREQKTRRRRKDNGLCIRCGLKLGEQDSGFMKCQNCREELCI